jgi:YD repeat-containing protein
MNSHHFRRRAAAALVLSAFAPCALSAGSILRSMHSIRQPLPPTYSDWCNVAGDYASGQAACDARGKAINYELTYKPIDEHHGECLDSRGNRLGYPFFGSGCPNPEEYLMKNYEEHKYCTWDADKQRYFGVAQYCESRHVVGDRYHSPPDQCPGIGNPIFPLTGAKRQLQALDAALLSRVLSFDAVYDSGAHLPSSTGTATLDIDINPSFGTWKGTWHRGLIAQAVSSEKRTFVAERGGRWQTFRGSDLVATDVTSDNRLSTVTGGYRLDDLQGLVQELYDANGVLTKTWRASGGSLSFAYSTEIIAGESPATGLLMSVTDTFGRKLGFKYELVAGVPAPRIYRVIGPDGQEIGVSYDAANNLSALTWPDGKAKTFVYERPDLPWALTGVVNERSKRFATFGYDSLGRANSTEHANGTNKHSARWSVPPSWNIVETFDASAGILWRDHYWTLPEGVVLTDPLGNDAALGAQLFDGVPRQVTRSQPSGSGCGAADSAMSYDARGNVTSRTDFNGVRSCYAHAADRHLETFRVEGLGEGDACPPDLESYQIPGNLRAAKPQRKISTQWHPKWALEARRAEPKRIVTTVYNGEPDVLNGNAVATCASGDPRLPDNNRIAVVCTRYEQSTDDDTGSSSFAAPVKETRKWSYTYDQFGQMLTETDPRGKTTGYDYWADTVFTGTGNAARGHQSGDLKRVTNALGQQTNYLEYNQRGQVLKTQFANGSQEQRAYHVRGWLTRVTLAPAGGGVNQVTQYDYYDNGLLKKVTQPDGSFASYTWDDAHRLTDVTDSVGNKVHYELDDAGNRTAEKFKDPQGTLAKTITRTFDALGRLSSSTGLQ